MAVGSVVDYLKSKGKDSSFSSRKGLAGQYGIANYTGSAGQNTNLLRVLQSGAQGMPQRPANAANGNNVTITPVGTPPGGQGPSYLTGYQYKKYSPSNKVNDYANRLEDLEYSKPGDYTSKYSGQIDSIVNNILNRQDFNPDGVYDTDLYKNYKEQYMQQGNKAMRDTIGTISGMTGGYGSTYATAAGQQAYDSHISQLGDKTLDLYDRIYQQYLNKGQDMYNQLGVVNNQDGIDYGRYRDTVNDYHNDLNYYAGRYDNSYAQDSGEYQQDQDAQRWAEQYAYQRSQDDYKKQQDALAQQNWQTQFDYQKQQDAQQYAMQQQKMAASRGAGGGGGNSRGGNRGSGRSSKSNTNSYITKAKNMLNGTDGSDTHKYQNRTVSNYLTKQYGLSAEDADYITSMASSGLQDTANKTIDKYYGYAKDYAKEHDADEVFDYLNRFYEGKTINEQEANEIYRRLGMD